MKVLVADDTLGNPTMVTHLLQDLAYVTSVFVIESMKEAALQTSVDVILLGGRWLSASKDFRDFHPDAYIIGRCPFFGDCPSEFFPWGNELRDPTLTLSRLLEDRLL